MKALTLWQPWASLIAWGEKQYETRSWSTQYRGPLAIHAGIGDDTQELIECNRFYREAFHRAGVCPTLKLPAGVVLCVVDLVDSVPTASVVGKISQAEYNFGDYSIGRWAWKLENVRVLKAPIAVRGYQGLWDWRADIESLVFEEKHAEVARA